MNVLVSYDVSTTSPEGRRRLRRVAQVCCDFGQRVQYSVFECAVGPTELVLLRQRLLSEIQPAEDSLRFYFLHGAFGETCETHGLDRRIDFEGPLVI